MKRSASHLEGKFQAVKKIKREHVVQFPVQTEEDFEKLRQHLQQHQSIILPEGFRIGKKSLTVPLYLTVSSNTMKLEKRRVSNAPTERLHKWLQEEHVLLRNDLEKFKKAKLNNKTLRRLLYIIFNWEKKWHKNKASAELCAKRSRIAREKQRDERIGQFKKCSKPSSEQSSITTTSIKTSSDNVDNTLTTQTFNITPAPQAVTQEDITLNFQADHPSIVERPLMRSPAMMFVEYLGQYTDDEEDDDEKGRVDDKEDDDEEVEDDSIFSSSSSSSSSSQPLNPPTVFPMPISPISQTDFRDALQLPTYSFW